MQQRPLYIIASPRPRVGKTLIARLLIEFFRASNRPVFGYDLNPGEPALTGYFPNLVSTVNIADTRGQMALFDRLIADGRRTTVIDLGYGLFDQFFSVMGEVGFEEEARRRLIEPIVLFIGNLAPSTARTYAELQRRLPNTTFVPVHNESASFMFIKKDLPPTRPEYGVVRIPCLSSTVRGAINRRGFSFAAHMANRPGNATEVHERIRAVFAQFRDLELRLLIGKLNSALSGDIPAQPREFQRLLRA
jgi:hypothetical protein